MWEGSYGREPFDVRLTVLRMIRQLNVIIGFTLAGAIVFGGAYCVKNVLFTEELYCAESTYHVEYAVEEESQVGTVHINGVTWNTYLDSSEFLDAVQERTETGMTNEELTEALNADLASDLRVPSTKVTTDDAAKSVQIAQAVESVMTESFPDGIREVVSIRVVDAATDAPLVINDVRVGRAFALSAVLSCFFTVIILLLKELGDDNIWLPATIGKRYGLKVVGTPESAELQENVKYLFGGKTKIAVCAVGQEPEPIQLLRELSSLCPETVGEEKGWFAAPSPILCPESAQVLREADGVLLAVRAGSHAGKQLEHVLEYMEQQDCKITAVILCEADEKLIQSYYRFQKA